MATKSEDESSPKVLFVENLSLVHDNPMSTCYNLKCNVIKNDPRFEFYDIGGKKDPEINLVQNVIFGCRSIYMYKCYKKPLREKIMARNLQLFKIPNKFFIIQDMHQKTYGSIKALCNILKENNVNIIFTFFHNNEASIIRSQVPNIYYYHLPHHIDTSIFRYISTSKKYDILLFGSIHPKHYPFRKKLFELISSNSHLFNVHYVKKPEIFDPSICESGLAQLINMSKICIATKSKYDYLVGKYFEIAGCKSLIAGNIPTDGLNILKGRILELNEMMTDDQIISTLSDAIENYDKFNQPIEELYTIVNEKYSLIHYVDRLHNIVLNKV